MNSIDSTVIAELATLDEGGGQDFICELITLFLNQTPASLERLNQGISRGDIKTVCFELHQLKSSSANLGVVHLNRLVQTFEDTATAGDLANAGASLRELRAEFARAETELRAIAEARTKKAA